ncbi:hypothetical protein [Arenimonas oryziterrae]|uniref:Thioredoxin domain-containing protein n=1 Tax=Arenimonas oryziterrae DSM 21050 = YC6267 TaxID=1121015 RepID=A0A091AVP8_9GAMM|nr:hypothetical protein [Arenimonas oryziterrae]KFN43481.1 hypothetical protein N789_09405 [Arenimonas oryziterrae DSM 21050 = YC6267]
MNLPAPTSQWRSRLTLLLIVAMFFSSFGIAAFLFFTGWTPAGSRNFGELLQPPKPLAGIPLQRADGRPYAWAPDKQRWQLVFVAPANCGEPCARMLDTLHRVWFSEGRQADRIELLWFGEVPAQSERFRALVPMAANPEFVAALPDVARPDSLPVYLVDPDGFLALRYPPGFNPSGLRKDLGRLLK